VPSNINLGCKVSGKKKHEPKLKPKGEHRCAYNYSTS